MLITNLKILSQNLLLTEDIYITQYGKIVSKLSNPFQNRIDIATSLFGILPDTITLEETKEERLSQL